MTTTEENTNFDVAIDAGSGRGTGTSFIRVKLFEEPEDGTEPDETIFLQNIQTEQKMSDIEFIEGRKRKRCSYIKFRRGSTYIRKVHTNRNYTNTYKCKTVTCRAKRRAWICIANCEKRRDKRCCEMSEGKRQIVIYYHMTTRHSYCK